MVVKLAMIPIYSSNTMSKKKSARTDLPKEMRSAGISKRRGYKPSAIAQSQNRRAEEAQFTRQRHLKPAGTERKIKKSSEQVAYPLFYLNLNIKINTCLALFSIYIAAFGELQTNGLRKRISAWISSYLVVGKWSGLCGRI